MGCNCCGCASALLSQEVGSAYYYVRLVADNIQLLQDLAAQMAAADPGQVINIVRGTTALIANGVITSDPDNSHIALSPADGTADDLTTIMSDPDGRVIILHPLDPGHTITLKAISSTAITSVDPFTDELTVAAHGLILGQLISLAGPGLPADLAAGAYYAVPTGADTFRVATSNDNAVAGTVVDIVNAGAGFLNIGNLDIGSDLALTGRETAILVKDGINYVLLGSSAVLPAVADVVAGLQPLSGILSSLSDLVLAGQAGHFIQVNATDDGFEVVDFGLTELTAELAAKAAVEHTHTIAEIDGLQTILDAKVDDTDLVNYYTKTEIDTAITEAIPPAGPAITVSTDSPTGGNDNDLWFKVAP